MGIRIQTYNYSFNILFNVLCNNVNKINFILLKMIYLAVIGFTTTGNSFRGIISSRIAV